MATAISVLFDAYHLYHLPQFDPLIDLLEKDNRFEVFYSTCSSNKKEEIDLCSSILKKRPGAFIFDIGEKKRAKKIRDLDIDVFICGWSRYKIDSFVSDKTLVIMIYHGIGVKPSYWRDNNERLDLRFVETHVFRPDHQYFVSFSCFLKVPGCLSRKLKPILI